MKASVLPYAAMVVACLVSPQSLAQQGLIGGKTQELLDKAKATKWERFTVKNNAGVVGHVVIERTPLKKETHTCPKDAPRRACKPGEQVTTTQDAGPTTTEKKDLALGQSYTNNFDVVNTKVRVSVFADVLSGPSYCIEKQQLDGSVKGMTFTLTGTGFKGSFKCDKTVE